MPTIPRRPAAQRERDRLQARRLAAAELFGAGVRQAAVARQLGVSAQAEQTLLAGQPSPDSQPRLVRCILDSLADTYARTVRDAVRLSGRPVEATALGNVLVQARAHGAVHGGLQALRLRANQPVRRYEPAGRT